MVYLTSLQLFAFIIIAFHALLEGESVGLPGSKNENPLIPARKFAMNVKERSLRHDDDSDTAKGNMNNRASFTPKFRRGLKMKPLGAGPSLSEIHSPAYRHDSVTVPEWVDWRFARAMTKVFDQGNCNSCWSVATTDAISMMWALARGDGHLPAPQNGPTANNSMSSQQVCDCLVHPCCSPGMPEWTLEYVASSAGLMKEADYPYVGEQQRCGVDLSSERVAKITGWELTPAKDTDALKKAVAQQPVLALLSSSTKEFEEYNGGVFKGRFDGKLDHVVVVVGYGTDPDEGPYWIIKNSWGTKWGENGFMRLAMEEGDGQMGITSSPAMYPVYFPSDHSDPCSSFPSPCGSGQCYKSMEGGKAVARCKCTEGFVESLGTPSGAKCVTATPCSRNPNPCGIGSCANNADGSHTCSCPKGYVNSAGSNGLMTCIPGSVGVKTYVVQPGDTCETIVRENKVDFAKFTALNGFVDCTKEITPAIALTLTTEDFSGAVDGVDQVHGLPHMVTAGETCDSICRDFILEKETFLTLNPGLDCSAKLTPGLSVFISGHLERAERYTSNVLCTKWHYVQHGDHCYSIWTSANLDHLTFHSLNPHVQCDPSQLFIGKKVCVEGTVRSSRSKNKFAGEVAHVAKDDSTIPYVVRKGDTLESIALDFLQRCGNGANSSAIMMFNAIPSVLKEGQFIHIPCSKLEGAVGLVPDCSDPKELGACNCVYCPADWVCSIPSGQFYGSHCVARCFGVSNDYKGYCDPCWAQCYYDSYSDLNIPACESQGLTRCPGPKYYAAFGCEYREKECWSTCIRSALSFYSRLYGRYMDYCIYGSNTSNDCYNFRIRTNWCNERCVQIETKNSRRPCYYP